MRYRPLGRSPLAISAVGFGTCQLRKVPERQALETLRRGFVLGVNFVHTAPDYEGAEDLVARAIAEARREVMVFTQGYGNMPHFEWLFDMACRRAGRMPLDVFGIACVEDRELLGENVWGPGGMVEFLLEQKRRGRLRAIFAESHGTPEYIARLIESGVFDAVLVAGNLLGFHALSYFPQPPGTFEDIARNRAEIFPLARRHGVSVLLMKSLGGGLECAGKAFEPHARFSAETHPLAAGELLRSLLEDPDVTAVVPGTASVAEADENARAGHAAAPLPAARRALIEASGAQMLETLCRRCGACDSLCSRGLPVSWLFRDAYVSTIRAETFETLDRLQYFHLHPQAQAACVSCDDVSCACPHGLDIPIELARVHEVMSDLRARGRLPRTPAELEREPARGPWGLKLVHAELPSPVAPGSTCRCTLWVENAGPTKWTAPTHWTAGAGIELHAVLGPATRTVALRHEVEPGTRTHFAFELTAPQAAGEHAVRFFLRTVGRRIAPEDAELWSCPLTVAA
jgi:predicted aldo/keto reductase-like oxidoreductase